MNLADPKVIAKILKTEDFSFKKSLGQNFLIDESVCPAMARAATDNETGVIEIGPGIGVLTKELALSAKKVVAIELDNRLAEILPKTLCDYDNIKVIFGDAMKLDLHEIIKTEFADCKKIAVCANLPYYITSPIIMMLLESRLPLDSITVMVQKEAADRITAEIGSREAGALSVAVNYYAEREILFSVPRTSFMPPPKVNSAVIKLLVRKNPPVKVTDEQQFFRFVKAAFAQRRKTLLNTVSNTTDISKNCLRAALNELDIPETVRSEQLTMEQLADISNRIF